MRQKLLVITGTVLALLAGAFAQAATHPAQWLPVVRYLYTAPNMTEPVLLVEHDCGFVNAVAIGGRYYIGYQLRPQGQVIIAEDTPNGLIPLPEPSALLTSMMSQQTDLSPAPSLTLPGSKQGSLSLVPFGGKIRAYYTGRPPGDPSGPFYVWRVDIDQPLVSSS